MKLSHILIVAIGLVPFALIACGATSSSQKIEVGAYEAEQMLCVDQAATKAESQACRSLVKAKYARMWADAGIEAGDASK